MTVGKKLMICIAGMLAVVLGLSTVGWISGERLEAELNSATKIGRRTIIGGEIGTEVASLRSKMNAMVMFALAHDQKRAKGKQDDFRAHVRITKAELAEIRPLLTRPKAVEMINSIDTNLDRYSAVFEQIAILISAEKAMKAMEVNRDSGTSIGLQMESATLEYGEFQKSAFAEVEASGAHTTVTARWFSMIFLAVGLAAVGLIGMVVRKITSELRAIAVTLSDGTSQIAAGSSEVSSSSQSLAQGASEQAGSLEETSASAEQITSMTRQNAANTSQVAELMNTVDQRVGEGNSTLSLMIGSMKQINDSSGKISKIIKVIDEIAFQTNILALNAAVEAARAGEAGMGFAVVADEVRNLAQRSAKAAKDTASLIEESITTSNEGSTQLQKVADVVGSITEAANKVKVLVDEVNIGSQEQAKGIEEIARSLTEMDKVTQSTAAAAEESASASEQMSAQAQALTHIVDRLRAMAG
jgi:methyl-accepting chemotaxis protein/methyl-accepting chemotaxis protein-1 (serine sensor receptor)